MENSVILIGRMGKEPVTKVTTNNKNYSQFSIATDSSYKDNMGQWQKKTEWHNITVWGKQSDYIQSTATKGSTIMVKGSLETRTYDKNGVKVYDYHVAPSLVRVLSGMKAKSDDQQGHVPQSNGDSDEELPF